MLLRMTRRRCVRPRLACAVHAPPTSERGDAGKALARRGWPCWCAGLPNARRGHWSRLVHDGARELEGNARSVLPSFALVAATGLLWARCAGPRARPRTDDGRAARSKHAFDLAARRLKPRDRHKRRPALDVHGGGSSCLYPLAVVPLARGAERPQGQRKITGARRQADPCVH